MFISGPRWDRDFWQGDQASKQLMKQKLRPLFVIWRLCTSLSTGLNRVYIYLYMPIEVPKVRTPFGAQASESEKTSSKNTSLTLSKVRTDSDTDSVRWWVMNRSLLFNTPPTQNISRLVAAPWDCIPKRCHVKFKQEANYCKPAV